MTPRRRPAKLDRALAGLFAELGPERGEGSHPPDAHLARLAAGLEIPGYLRRHLPECLACLDAYALQASALEAAVAEPREPRDVLVASPVAPFQAAAPEGPRDAADRLLAEMDAFTRALAHRRVQRGYSDPAQFGLDRVDQDFVQTVHLEYLEARATERLEAIRTARRLLGRWTEVAAAIRRSGLPAPVETDYADRLADGRRALLDTLLRAVRAVE